MGCIQNDKTEGKKQQREKMSCESRTLNDEREDNDSHSEWNKECSEVNKH